MTDHVTGGNDEELYALRDLIASHIACEEECKAMPTGCGCALTAARAVFNRHAQLQPDLPAETGVIHKLKTWPDYFNDILSGRKLFEWRIEDDRLYRVGDVLLLQEWVPVSENLGCKEGKYTGREIRKLVSYRFVTFPTNKRTVVMSLAPVGASALPSTPSGTESSVPASEDRTDGR